MAAPLARFGTASQKKRYLSRLVSGAAAAAAAVSEEPAGSDVSAIQCAASTAGGGWSLSGRKLYVSGTASAAFFLVWARRAGTCGSAGLDCFIVDRGARGLKTTERPWLIGPAEAAAGELRLERCRVPADRRLGGEGGGFAVLSYALQLERRYLLAPAVGAMERALDRCVRRAGERRQFGRAISDFQAVSHRLAGMKLRLEACASLLERACAQAAGFDDPLAPVVKATISEAWTANCLDAVQIFGAAGCLQEAWLRDDLHAAIASRLFSGSSEIQRELIAASLSP